MFKSLPTSFKIIKHNKTDKKKLAIKRRHQCKVINNDMFIDNILQKNNGYYKSEITENANMYPIKIKIYNKNKIELDAIGKKDSKYCCYFSLHFRQNQVFYKTKLHPINKTDTWLMLHQFD